MIEPIPRSLFLTGFMGAGKSTVGPALAAAQKLPFVDLDRAIELHAQRPIPEIFRTVGEAEFRRIEAQVLRDQGAPAVVALGGGTLLDANNRVYVGEHGTLIYLRASLDVLAVRTAHSDRPLLQGHQGLDDKVRALFAAREPGYLSATIVVDTDGVDVATIVTAIQQELQRCDA